jgi:hypothetical protein
LRAKKTALLRAKTGNFQKMTDSNYFCRFGGSVFEYTESTGKPWEPAQIEYWL